MIVTESFMDTPIAELEAYGLSVKTISQLETNFKAIYIRDLKDLTSANFRGTWIAAVEIYKLKRALEACLRDCRLGIDSRDCKFKREGR